MIHDVTAEIKERLVDEEEEQQPVSEVESHGCYYSYRRVNLCHLNQDELRAKLTLSNLKSICLKYGIQEVSGNRKEPYVNALFSFIEAKPCSLYKGLPQYSGYYLVLSISFERFFPYREGAHLFSLKVNTSTWL